jgi:hypothetical protein
MPWDQCVRAYAGELEPRTTIAHLISAKIARGSTLVFDASVGMDPRALPRRSSMVELDLKHQCSLLDELAARKGALVVVVPRAISHRCKSRIRHAHVVARVSADRVRGPTNGLREVVVLVRAGAPGHANGSRSRAPKKKRDRDRP